MLKTIHSLISSVEVPNLKDKNLIRSEQADLCITPRHEVDIDYERATFGMGCFWGAESLFGGTKGVLRTRVGYSGGKTKIPSYKNIGDHTEVVEIDFDPKTISYEDLLTLFWNNHEYGLTNKMKNQYRSLILYHSENQRKIAEKSLKDEQERRGASNVISTVLQPAQEFYPAEDYHQKYRLQGHKELVKSLGVTSELLQKSTVATKLNGYLVGVGGMQQFLKEADFLGLTPSQREYVRHYLELNEGGTLYC